MSNFSDRYLALVERLKKAEKQHDFYTTLYRQYSADLLTQACAVRLHPCGGAVT